MIEIWHPEISTGQHSKAAYDVIYTGDGIRLMDSFYLWLIALMAPSPGSRLLDVSCGEGALVGFARHRGVEACGVDFSDAAVRRARHVMGHAAFVVANGVALPYGDTSFDFVSCIGSLEHFANPAAGMREIARVLRVSGTACILLPNTFSLLGNVNYARKYGAAFDDCQPIQRYHTRVGWAGLLEENGLRVRRTEKFEMVRPRTRADWLWYLRRPAKVAHLALVALLPLNLANSFVYLCAKA
jgi:SAM-dependent methyltransferase